MNLIQFRWRPQIPQLNELVLDRGKGKLRGLGVVGGVFGSSGCGIGVVVVVGGLPLLTILAIGTPLPAPNLDLVNNRPALDCLHLEPIQCKGMDESTCGLDNEGEG